MHHAGDLGEIQGRYRGSHVHHVRYFGEMKGRYRGVMCTTPEPAKSMTPVRMTLSCRGRDRGDMGEI